MANDTIWLAISTVLTAVITTGGAIAVAMITTRQRKTNDKVQAIHDQLQTSNGKTIANVVEDIASNQ